MKIGELKNKVVPNMKGFGTHPEIVIEEVLDESLYNDVTSVTTWITIGSVRKDYVYIRTRLKELVPSLDFWALPEGEKEILFDYCVIDVDTSFAYLASKGVSEAQIGPTYLKTRVRDTEKAGLCYVKRIKSVEFKSTFLMFTDEAESQVFSQATSKLVDQLKEIGLLGIGYSPSDIINGICNYIGMDEGYEYSGLSTYSMNAAIIAAYGSQEAAVTALSQALLDIVLNGI